MKLPNPRALSDFERACDELFDEWLGRWRGGAAVGAPAGALVTDRGEDYVVQVEAVVDDPEVIDVEISEAGLIVRIPSGARPAIERRLTFAHAVDHERTTARWTAGLLTIVMPKLRGRRVKVQ